MSGDEITLTIPREEEFRHVAHLVLGGVAVRSNFTYESLDDLETALDTLLEHADREGDLTVTVRVGKDAIEAMVGPFRDEALGAELEREIGDEFSLRRVLETVVDGVEHTERDGAQWVTLTKAVRRGETGS